MLIQACEISPGDLIVVSAHRHPEIVRDTILLEDGAVYVEYENGGLEWLRSNHVVLRKDKTTNFFGAEAAQKIQDGV